MEPIEGGESARRKQPPPAAVWTVCAPLGPPKPAARLTGRLGSELSRAQCIEGEVKTAGGRLGGQFGDIRKLAAFRLGPLGVELSEKRIPLLNVSARIVLFCPCPVYRDYKEQALRLKSARVPQENAFAICSTRREI